MLGKIIKHEFKATWKSIVGMFAIIIAMLIISSVSYMLQDNDYDVMPTDILNIVTGISIFLLVMSLICGSVIIIVVMCKRFFDSVYSNQGYLTLTLPVNKLTILNGKIITYFVWSVATLLVVIPSGWAYICLLADEDFSKIFDYISDYLYECDNFFTQVVIPLLSGAFSIIQFFLFIFACLSMGQLSNKHKIGSAIGWGFIFRVIQSVIGGIASYFFTLANKGVVSSVILGFLTGRGRIYTDSYNKVIFFNFFMVLVFTAFYYMITGIIMTKKVNLQ